MREKLIRFLRENIFIFSIITMLIGLIIFIIGMLGIWFQDEIINILNFMDILIPWCPYIFVIGENLINKKPTPRQNTLFK